MSKKTKNTADERHADPYDFDDPMLRSCPFMRVSTGRCWSCPTLIERGTVYLDHSNTPVNQFLSSELYSTTTMLVISRI